MRPFVIAILALFAGALVAASAAAQTGEPIKIGYSMALTGGLSANGRSALLAQKIWEEDTNAKGGLLGRPVKLIYYDDQTNPATVPGIYAKLLDVDKVDLIIGPYATNLQAPAIPIAMQRKKVFIGLLATAVNSTFNYPSYFSMAPNGPDPKLSYTKGFIDLAMRQNPKPQTVAIVAADGEFALNVSEGARQNVKAAGLTVVYDRRYPSATTDLAPVVRAIAETNPDLVIVCSYPPNSVGMVRAVNEVGFKPKMIGGAMVGLQSTAIKARLGPLLNGWTNYDAWLPVPKMQFAGVDELMKKYQARAAVEGVDALGYYMAPWSYAQLQVLQQAVVATTSLDDSKLGDYIRANTFKTVLGDVRFGTNGELAQSRVLQVQFRNIKSNDLAQFKDISTQIVVAPFAVIQAVAPSLGVEVFPIDARDGRELERRIMAFAGTAGGGLIVSANPSVVVHRELIAKLAAQHKLPAIYNSTRVCRRWRPVFLCSRFYRPVPARSRLRRPHPQGRQAGRPAGTGADQVRAGDQPQDRQGARHRHAAVAARPRRRGDRMKRREFIAGLGGAAAAWPRAARAQERVRRIGVLMHTAADEPEAQARLAAFLQGLQEAGWTVGRNVRIETRWSTAINAPTAQRRGGPGRARARTSSWPASARPYGRCCR